MGRFINGDALVSTDQNLLSTNMFTYCVNNPIVYIDPNGFRFIGYGFQIDFQIGDVSYGYEVVIYTDDEICRGEDYLVTTYSYSGYDVSVGDLQKIYDIAEVLITTAVFESRNDNAQAFYSAVTTVLNGAGLSGGAFLLYGNENFKTPLDYSGGFETWSGSVKIKGATVTGFHSFTEKCDAYGVKIGMHLDGLRKKGNNPFGIAYSRSDYSAPCILEF